MTLIGLLFILLVVELFCLSYLAVCILQLNISKKIFYWEKSAGAWKLVLTGNYLRLERAVWPEIEITWESKI